VNGPERVLACPACRRKLEIAAAHFGAMLESFEEDHHALARRARTISMSRVECRVKKVSSRALAGMRAGPVPTWLRERCPTAQAVWCPATPDAGPPAAAVSLGCPDCARSLKVRSDSARVVACPACAAQVWVPDALWERFHPVPVIQTWIVELHGENEWDKERRLARERERAERLRERRKHAHELERERERRARRATKVALLERRAARRTWMHLAVTVAALAWPWMVRAGVGVGPWTHMTTAVLIGATLPAQLLALGACGDAIRATEKRGDMTFVLWFELAFVWFMPVIGHMLGVGRIFDLYWGDSRREIGPTTRWGAHNWTIIVAGGLALIASTLLASLL
jgi:uncharacterized protein YbaR (Trm112 family)